MWTSRLTIRNFGRRQKLSRSADLSAVGVQSRKVAAPLALGILLSEVAVLRAQAELAGLPSKFGYGGELDRGGPVHHWRIYQIAFGIVRGAVPHHAARVTGRKLREMSVARRNVNVESSGCCGLILNGQRAPSEQSELVVGGVLAEPFADGLADPRAINAVHELPSLVPATASSRPPRVRMIAGARSCPNRESRV